MASFAELGCLAATTHSSPGGNGNGGEASPTGWVSGNPQGGGMGSGNGIGNVGSQQFDLISASSQPAPAAPSATGGGSCSSGIGGMDGGGMGGGMGGGGMGGGGMGGGGMGGLGIGGCGMGGAGSCGNAASPQEQVVPAAKSAGQHYEGYQPQSLEQQPHGYPPQGLFVEQPGDANGSGSSMSNLASDLALERRTEMAGGEPSPLRSTPPQKLEPRPQQQLAPDATLAFAALAQGRPYLPRQAQLARPSSISSAELPLSRCRGFSL